MEKTSKTNQRLNRLKVMGTNRRLISITLALSSVVFGIWINYALTYRSTMNYISAAFWLAIVILSYKALQIECDNDKER